MNIELNQQRFFNSSIAWENTKTLMSLVVNLVLGHMVVWIENLQLLFLQKYIWLFLKIRKCFRWRLSKHWKHHFYIVLSNLLSVQIRQNSLMYNTNIHMPGKMVNIRKCEHFQSSILVHCLQSNIIIYVYHSLGHGDNIFIIIIISKVAKIKRCGRIYYNTYIY